MKKIKILFTEISIIFIILFFYLLTVFLVSDLYNTNYLKHKLIHINGKVVDSRWVLPERNK